LLENLQVEMDMRSSTSKPINMTGANSWGKKELFDMLLACFRCSTLNQVIKYFWWF